MTFGAVALNAARGAGERSLHPASGQAAAVPGPTYCQTNKLSFKSAADRGTWRTLGRRRGRARSFRGMSPSRAPARHCTGRSSGSRVLDFMNQYGPLGGRSEREICTSGTVRDADGNILIYSANVG